MDFKWFFVICVIIKMTTGDFVLEEAAQVTLESGQRLLLSNALFRKIEYELNSIRRVYRQEVGSIFHQPKWTPGYLGFQSPVTDKTKAKLEKLNRSRYGPIRVLFGDLLYRAIDFSRPFQPETLFGIADSEFGLRTRPNFYIGRNSTIEYNPYKKEYVFSRGSGDCSSGCSRWQRYWFQESDENGNIYLVWQSEIIPPKTRNDQQTTNTMKESDDLSQRKYVKNLNQ